MSAFARAEIAYMRGQRLDRLATVNERGGKGINADFGAELIRHVPEHIVGPLDTDVFRPNGRSVS